MSHSQPPDGTERTQAKLTVPEIRARKGSGSKLTMVTAYDYPTARFVEAAGMDLILVGDSVGTAVLGYETTVPVTMSDILHHTKAVVRGAPRTFVVADLPFMSYQLGDAQALENAGRLLQEGGADAVKLEGMGPSLDRIRAIAAAGIPIVGHVGLTPQTVGSLGGYKVQGRDLASARAIVAGAEAIAEAGAFLLVVEAVPAELGAIISERVAIPTIGIGAGAATDGQVLVTNDLLGMEQRFAPKFIKRYAELGPEIEAALRAYADEVQRGVFPAKEHTYALKPEVAQVLRRVLNPERSLAEAAGAVTPPTVGGVPAGDMPDDEALSAMAADLQGSS